MAHVHTRWGWLAIVGSMLLVLAACGQATPAQKAPDHVVFGVVSLNAGNWPAQIGIEKGFFKQNNIDFELVRSSSSVEATAALVGGSMQFTTATIDAAIVAQAKAPEMKQVIMGFDKVPYSLFTRPDITDPNQLKGKTCGGNSLKTADSGYIRLILREFGLVDEKDYTIIVIGANMGQLAALQNKQVDCIAQIEPAITTVLKAGMRELVKASDLPSLKGYPFFSVISMKSWYGANDANRDIAVRTTMGWIQSVRWLYDPKNKEDALQVLMKYANVQHDNAESAYNWVSNLKGYPTDGRITPANVQRVMELQIAMGDLKPPLPATESLIDSSLTDEAVKRLDAKK